MERSIMLITSRGEGDSCPGNSDLPGKAAVRASGRSTGQGVRGLYM